MLEQNYRRILVAVSGMSPQIITETLYGLRDPERKDGQWIPHEIHLITTEEGSEQARLQLLERNCQFRQFLRDYGIHQPIRFGPDTIHVITDAEDKPLPDLRTPEDNEAAADFIIEKIRELTNMESTELHVSLAGGRKTMGFYVGYALSLFGRVQDRLSHVLVSPEYESLRDFFYPTPKTHPITRSGLKVAEEKQLDAAKAKVWLADIPFVRLRGFLSEDALVNRARFSEVVALVDILAREPQVTLQLSQRQLRIGPLNLPLPPRELALYVVFARKALEGVGVVHIPKKGNAEIAEEYMQALQDIKGRWDENDATGKALEKGMEREYFDSTKARLNKSLERALGKRGAQKYQIQSGARRSSTFFLALEPEQISIEE